MVSNNLCPLCGIGKLTEQIEYDEIEYLNVTVEIPFCSSVCNYCLCETSDTRQAKFNKEAYILSKKYAEYVIKTINSIPKPVDMINVQFKVSSDEN